MILVTCSLAHIPITLSPRSHPVLSPLAPRRPANFRLSESRSCARQKDAYHRGFRHRTANQILPYWAATLRGPYQMVPSIPGPIHTRMRSEVGHGPGMAFSPYKCAPDHQRVRSCRIESSGEHQIPFSEKFIDSSTTSSGTYTLPWRRRLLVHRR